MSCRQLCDVFVSAYELRASAWAQYFEATYGIQTMRFPFHMSELNFFYEMLIPMVVWQNLSIRSQCVAQGHAVCGARFSTGPDQPPPIAGGELYRLWGGTYTLLPGRLFRCVRDECSTGGNRSTKLNEQHIPKDDTKVEVVREAPDPAGGGMWFYCVRGSGIYLNVGRTRAFDHHRARERVLPLQLPSASQLLKRVRDAGLDTIQHVNLEEHGLFKHEIYSAGAVVTEGTIGCFPRAAASLFSRGWGGVIPCSCIGRVDLNCDGGQPLHLVNHSYSQPSTRLARLREQTVWPDPPLLIRVRASGLAYDLSRYKTLPCPWTLNDSVWRGSASAQPAAVCVVNRRVGRRSAWSKSFSDATSGARFLLKCWSFFLRFPRRQRLLWNQMNRRVYKLTESPWQAALVKAMGASWVSRRGVPDCAVLWSVPTRSILPGAGEAFFHKTSDAQQLAALVLTQSMTSVRGHSPLRVGIVTVGVHKRKAWLGARGLRDCLSRHPPRWVGSASLCRTTEMRSLKDQAAFYRAHEIIVASSGEHNVNFAFVEPGTLALELMDPDRLIAVHLHLAIEAGGRGFFMVQTQSINASLGATLHAATTHRRAPTRNDRNEAAVIPEEAVFNAVRILAMVHRSNGETPAHIPFDEIPTFGGPDALKMQPSSHPCLHCDAFAVSNNCCFGKEAQIAFAEGGFGCRHCLNQSASIILGLGLESR